MKLIFTMGKGGVGKTTVASAIAVGLVEKGHRVDLIITLSASSPLTINSKMNKTESKPILLVALI